MRAAKRFINVQVRRTIQTDSRTTLLCSMYNGSVGLLQVGTLTLLVRQLRLKLSSFSVLTDGRAEGNTINEWASARMNVVNYMSVFVKLLVRSERKDNALVIQVVQLVLLRRFVSDSATLNSVQGERLEERWRKVLGQSVRRIVRNECLLPVFHYVCLSRAADDTHDELAVLVAYRRRERSVAVPSNHECIQPVRWLVIVVTEAELAFVTALVRVIVSIRALCEGHRGKG